MRALRAVFFSLATLVAFAAPALAQNPGFFITGPVTPGHCVKFVNRTQGQDSGAVCAGAAGVTTFNTRSGAVVPASGDYSFAQISGTLTPATQMPASGVGAGTFGSATQCVSLTVTAQGVVTAASATTCTPAFTSLTGSIAIGQIPNGLITYAKLQNETANTVLGSTVGGTPPAELALPSCSTAISALSWSSGVGFGCNNISGSGTIMPQGRLTLVSGAAEIASDTVSTNIFYAPSNGNLCPVLIGGTDTPRSFTSSAADQIGLTLALAGNAAWPAATLFDVFCVVDAGTLKLATRQWDAGMLPTEPQITNATTITTGTGGNAWTSPGNAFNGTVNQTSANSAVVGTSNTGLSNCLGQDWGIGVTKIVSKVLLTAPTDNPLLGSAPTSLQIEVDASNDNSNWRRIDIRNINSSTSNTTYTIPINKMKLNAGSASRYHRVCLTGNNTNALRVSQIQFFNIVAPANGRRLMKYNGRLTNDATVPTMRTGAGTTISTAINEGTFLGVFQTDPATNGQVSFTFEFGASRMLNLWNAYNPRTVTASAGIPTVAPYSYNITTPANIDWGPMQATTTFSVQVVSGYAFETVSASLIRPAYIQASAANAGYEAGIGVDTTLGFSGTEFSTTLDTSGQNLGLQGSAAVTLSPYYGTHTFFGVEKAAYTLPGIIAVFTDIQNTGISLTTRY